ncbi:MAG: hypothetical protein WCI54_09020 [Bacteroidia bacterium]
MILNNEHIKPYLLQKLQDKTAFIAGNAKNAGKTTFLNYLLPILRTSGNPLVYTSIGVDGEDFDRITSQRKPQIVAVAGDFVVTTSKALQNKGFQLVEAFPFNTTAGQIVMGKATRPTKVELIGPEDNESLASILEVIKTQHQITTVLIDGAINRITQLASAANPVYVFVATVDSRNVNEIMSELKRLSVLNEIPVWDKIATDSEEIQGALTETRLTLISASCNSLVISDFTKIFLTLRSLLNLLQTRKIYFKNRFPMLFCVLNLKDISRQQCEDHLNKIGFSIDVLFNPYQQNPS